MTGALIQLVSIGKQDKFFIGKPEFSFFKKVYKRYCNFAIETKEILFSGNSDFGKKTSAVIKKDGDLISDIALNIHLGSLNSNTSNIDNNCANDINEKVIFSWVNSIGHVLLEYVEIEIGGCVIDKHYGEWYEIWNELSMTYDKKKGYNQLIGKVNNIGYSYTTFQNELNLIIPLQFWFCKYISLALPCIAILNQEININIKWKEFNDLWICNYKDKTPKIPAFKSSLLINYIYLDADERREIVKKKHYILIDQLQYNGENFFKKNDKNPKVKLNFYHPVKELVWVFQRTDIIGSNYDDLNNIKYGNDWFNYSAFKNNLNYDFFKTAKINMNNTTRINNMSAIFYRLYNPLKHHTSTPNNFIYCYSFSISPEKYQPSGVCNFSLINNVNLIFNLNKNITSDYKIKVFGINLNILIIKNGNASIGFYN